MSRTRLLALVTGFCAIAGTHAADVVIRVQDASGSQLDGAIVALYRTDADAPDSNLAASGTHVMDQIDKQFSPRVLAIQAGDKVSFPNSDQIRHHVYSFSPAKTFELPLYNGIATDPVEFDKTGQVAVGCNIHDGMSAHIYIVDSSIFGVTADGAIRFSAVSPGNYEYTLMHPRSLDVDGARTELVVGQDLVELTASVELREAPQGVTSELSPLQKKFKALRRAAN
jgi:plastocyanin